VGYKLLKYAAPEAALPADLAGDRLIRPGHLATLLGVSLGTVYRLVRAGRIPRPRRLSQRVSGWRAAEILPLVRGAGGLGDPPAAAG
jgi:predicted DNA-binding transcriptional regulator AlpA